MNRYWFLKFSKHLSIWYDFSKFHCLVVKAGFNFTTCLAPCKTIFLSWIGTPHVFTCVVSILFMRGAYYTRGTVPGRKIFLSVIGTPHVLSCGGPTQFMRGAIHRQ